MKKLSILTMVLLAIGIVSFSTGCGSSSSSGSSSGGGGNVKGSLSSLPNANLTVSNVGNAASSAISSANVQPPSSVSSITSGTVSGSISQSIPTLSFLFKHLGNNVVIKPQSMKGNALNALSTLKQAVASGSCSPTTYADNSTPGNLDVTVTWDNVSCTYNSETLSFNGTVSVTGTYDTTLGNLDVTEALNLTFGLSDPAQGINETITLSGSDTITGVGIVTAWTSISYTEKGTINISASVTSSNGSGSFSGWTNIDDVFTGTPTELTYSINDGEEIDSGGSKVIGVYSVANITMTIGTTVIINGSGAFGVAAGSGASAYSGKVSVTYSALTFDNSCYSGPTAGTLTITADHTFVFDFNSQTCGCAAVTEDGTTVSGSPICGIY